MSISYFPTALQGIIQQNYLEREFTQGLRSKLGYRQIAEKMIFPNGVGESVTKTRPGLKAPVTTYSTPADNTNLDNGMTPAQYAMEQYTLSIGMLNDTMDLNIVTSKVGLASQFLQNALATGIQAMQSIDRRARLDLFNAYMGGNTRVTATLGSPAATIAVDDIRGFQYVLVNGVSVPVSSTNTLACTVNGTTYTLQTATADGSNVSSVASLGGISGTLTFSANVSTTNGTTGNAVVAGTAPTVIRVNSRSTTAALVAGDTLTMKEVLKAVATLRSNAVPTINGRYNIYISDSQMLQLFNDTQFQTLYRGAYQSDEFKNASIVEFLDMRFITTTEVPMQTLSGVVIYRAIVCGADSLVEGDFEGIAAIDVSPISDIRVVDNVAMVTRPPLDRAGQIIAQSWYWIGGFVVPTDKTADNTIIPTATNSYYKRCVIIESGG